MADPGHHSSDEEKTVYNDHDHIDNRSPSLIAKEGPLDEQGMVAVSKKLKNPLSGMNREELLANVEAFAKEKELEDILPLLQRGAIVAQDPKNFENVSELPEEEKVWLRKEVTNRWVQPKMMFYMTSMLSTPCTHGRPMLTGMFSSLCWISYRTGYGSDCCKRCSDLLLR